MKQLNDGESRKGSKFADRPSEDDLGLPEYSLGCEWLSSRSTATHEEFECLVNADSPEGKPLPSPEVKIADHQDYVAFIDTVAEGANYRVLLRFDAKKAYLDLFVALEADVSFSFKDSQIQDTSQKLGNLLSSENQNAVLTAARGKVDQSEAVPAADSIGFRSFRLNIASVQQTTPEGDVCIEQLEFRINNQWYQGNFSSNRGSIGPYTAVVSATSVISLPDFRREPYMAFNGKDSDLFWGSALNITGQTAPFDIIGDPIRFVIDFPFDRLEIQGLKIDGGVVNAPVPTACAPDTFWLEGSNDGVEWFMIDGSLFQEVPTSEIVERIWKADE